MRQEQYRQVFRQCQRAIDKHTVSEYEKQSSPNVDSQGRSHCGVKAYFWQRQETYPLLALNEERKRGCFYSGFAFYCRLFNRRVILTVAG